MAFTHALSTNNYGTAKFIVSATAAYGTHTTIASAISDASSGETIFIRSGTYTEDLTLKAGVNLSAYECDDANGVTIIGNTTASYNGTVQIVGVRFQTNSAPCLTLSGSSSSELSLFSCFINATNNDGISVNAANFALYLNQCRCVSASTYKLFSITTIAGLAVYQGIISSVDSTASTIDAGSINLYGVDINLSVSTSSTGVVNCFNSRWSHNQNNSTVLTTAGTGSSTVNNTTFYSGTASSISVGSGTILILCNCQVDSSNANAITGAGTLKYGALVFTGSSSTINTSTATALPHAP